MTYEVKASYDSTPPCSVLLGWIRVWIPIVQIAVSICRTLLDVDVKDTNRMLRVEVRCCVSRISCLYICTDS